MSMKVKHDWGEGEGRSLRLDEILMQQNDYLSPLDWKRFKPTPAGDSLFSVGLAHPTSHVGHWWLPVDQIDSHSSILYKGESNGALHRSTGGLYNKERKRTGVREEDE